jgi:hypothetical protein
MQKKDRLLDEELDLLANEVADLKLTHRADIDTLKLEIEALKLLLGRLYPNFQEEFRALREKVRLEVNPE